MQQNMIWPSSRLMALVVINITRRGHLAAQSFIRDTKYLEKVMDGTVIRWTLCELKISKKIAGEI